jgi:hypothetical protein
MIKGFILLAGLGAALWPKPSHAVPFQLHAKTWNDAGKVMHSTDTLHNNYNGNWQQSMGMQIYGSVQLAERLEGGFGLGMAQVYHSLGNSEQEKFTLSKFINYVSEARLTYTLGEHPNPLFSADIGNFAFNYAPQNKNLGLYLFRGPVYPGFLVSGFKEFHTDTTRATFLGLHLHNGLGNFQHDLLFSSERDLPPSFDWSLGYVARYKAFNALELGAGINFYHLISENEDITAPSRTSTSGLFEKDSALIASGAAFSPYELQYMEVTAPGDTVTYKHRGTKVMGLFSLDIKRLLGLDAPFGEKDLILYGEGAIVGTKNYGTVYSKMSERMPIMIGFNLPTFGWLDFLSLEVERYQAKFKPDYRKLGYDRSLYFKNIAAPQLLAQKSPSAIPISLKDLAGDRYTITTEGNFINNQTGDTVLVRGTELDPENLTADDWKWSLNVEKTFVHHVQISAQIANDHFVNRPVRSGLITETGGLSQIFTSMKDWYWMLRVGYFF